MEENIRKTDGANNEKAESENIPKEKFRFVTGRKTVEKARTGKPVGYFGDAFRRFCKNKGAMVAAIVVLLQLLFALIAPVLSGYDVEFRDPYYLKTSPSLPFLRERRWGVWDGSVTVEGGQARFDVYDGIGREMSFLSDVERSRAPLIKASRKHARSGEDVGYIMTLDTYYEVGFIYKDLSKNEYDALKNYQNETGIQVIYPLQSNHQAVGANQWYKLKGEHQAVATKLHGEKSRYAQATKAAGERDGRGELIPDYKLHFDKNAFGYDSLRLDFSSSDYAEGKPMYAPPVVAADSSEETYKLQKDENGRLYYWYDDETGYAYRDENYAWQRPPQGVTFHDVPGYYVYAFENQSGFRVRANYYEYFKFLHGKYPSFPFGTNQYGQDVFVCLASGARLSFLLAFCVSLINLTIGAIYGAISGYYGGRTDIIMQRIAEILSAVPFIVVATLFQLHVGVRAGPVVTFLFAFVLTGWLTTAARVRAQFYRYKGREYALAARTLGASDARIIFKHIFPNAIGTIITGAALAIPAVIFSESMLSYLGIINFETSKFTSLGTMLAQGQTLIGNAPHVLLFPAIFIALLEIGFNLFGNGLRDAFNPALR